LKCTIELLLQPAQRTAAASFFEALRLYGQKR